MGVFPSGLERSVASALLLLSTMPPLPPPPSCGLSGGSSVTSAGSSKEVQSQKLRLFAVVARYHDKKNQVVRKRRSEVTWSSKKGKVVLALPSVSSTSMSLSAEDSCLTTISSEASSLRSRGEVGMKKIREKRASGSGSAHMRRQAENILSLLSAGGCYSEVRIRQALGDSPDTSKALRMLLKREKVKRSGNGGRVDPYIYEIA